MSTYTRTRWGLKVCIIFSAFLFILGGIFTLNTLNKDIKAEEVSTSEGGAKRVFNVVDGYSADRVMLGESDKEFSFLVQGDNEDEVTMYSFDDFGWTQWWSPSTYGTYCSFDNGHGTSTCDGFFPKGALYKVVYGVNDTGEAMNTPIKDLESGTLKSWIATIPKYLQDGEKIKSDWHYRRYLKLENRKYSLSKYIYEENPSLQQQSIVAYVPGVNDLIKWGFLNGPLTKASTPMNDSTLGGKLFVRDGGGSVALSSGGMALDDSGMGMYDEVAFSSRRASVTRKIDSSFKWTKSAKAYVAIDHIINPYLKPRFIYLTKGSSFTGKSDTFAKYSVLTSMAGTEIDGITIEGQGPFDIQLINEGTTDENDIDLFIDAPLSENDLGKPLSSEYYLDEINADAGTAKIKIKDSAEPGEYPTSRVDYIKIQAKDLYNGSDADKVYPGGMDDPDRTITRVFKVQYSDYTMSLTDSYSTLAGMTYTPTPGLKIGVNTTKGTVVGKLEATTDNQISKAYTYSDVISYDARPTSQTTFQDSKLFELRQTDTGYDLVLKENVVDEKTYSLRIYPYSNTQNTQYAQYINAIEYVPPTANPGFQSEYVLTYGNDQIKGNTNTSIGTAKPSINVVGYETDTFHYEILSTDVYGTTYPDGQYFNVDDDGNLRYTGDQNLAYKKDGYKILVQAKSNEHNIKGTQTITIKVNKADPKIKFDERISSTYSFVLNEEVDLSVLGDVEGTVVYASSDRSVASITGTKFTMKKAGTFTLYATASATLNYNEKIITKQITLSDLPAQDPEFQVNAADTRTWSQDNNVFTPTVSGGQGDGAIAWEILDNSPVASINPGTGEITVLSAGTFTLRVTKSGGGIYQDAIEEVVIDVLPLKVNVKPNSITQTYGQYWNSVDKQGVTYTPMNDILQTDIDSGSFGTLEINNRYSEFQKPGTYAAGTIASGLTSNGNYVFEYDYGELVIEASTLASDPTSYFQIRSGTLGEHDWYISDIVLESQSLDDYDLISNDGIVFGDATILSTEGESDNHIYLRNSTTGVIAGPITYTSKIDKSDPVLTFTYENKTKSLVDQLRTFSFDHYFDDVKLVKFDVEDIHSGASDVTYTISEIDADGNVVGTPIEDIGTSYELAMSKKYRISAIAKDNAGRSSKTVEETVILSDEVNTVKVDALDSQGQAYTTQTWTSDEITLTPTTEGGYPVDHYSYVLDDTTVDPMPSDSVTIPNTNNGKHKIRFTAHQENGLKPEASYEVWIDTIKPDVVLEVFSNETEVSDGATLSDSVTIKLSNTTNNASGITYQCSTDQTAWKSCESEFTVSEGGTYTYSVKAVSGAGVESDPQQIGFTIVEYEQPTVTVTANEKPLASGTWTNQDIVFTIDGGMKDTALLQGYEYTTTTAQSLPVNTTWNDLGSEATLTIDTDMNGVYYWFRAKGCTSNSFISEPFIVKRDTTAPDKPTFTIETVNDNVVAKVINALSFGAWMKESVEVTASSTDTGSGIAYYEIQEIKESGTEAKRVDDGAITYTSDIKATLIAVAYDQAGNASAASDESGEILIDKTAPSIAGVKDQSEYKQYYFPRYVTITDIPAGSLNSGSGIKSATYTKDGGSAVSFTEGVEEPIEGEGTYVIDAEDHAGNTVTLTFKIVPFPKLDEIDGSDKSKEIIDQIEKELEEVRDHLDPTESKDYDKWISDATDSWTSQRLKEVVHQETTSKIQGVNDTTFDPSVELMVEQVEESSLPETPKKPLHGYRVYLKKANDVVKPNGTVKVYLPYTLQETPIVYMVDDTTQQVSNLSVKVEGSYITFQTNILSTYVISNVAQPDTGTDDEKICSVGPDGKPNTSDDVCGKPNGNGDVPIVNPDGSVTVPDGGTIVFPDGSEIVVPDGGTIKPDGSVETPDKDYNPDGSIKDPDDNNGGNGGDTPNPDDGKVCSVGPDGKPNTSDDVCGKPNEGGDQPIVNPDGSITIPDGGTIVFPDGSEVVVPDGGTIKPDGSVETPDKDYNPDGSIKDPDDNNGGNGGGDTPKPNPDDKPNPTPNPDDGNGGNGGGDTPKPNPDDKPNPTPNPDDGNGGNGGDIPKPNPDDKPNPTPNPDDGNGGNGGDTPKPNPDDKPNPTPNPDDGNGGNGGDTPKPNPDDDIVCTIGPDGKPNTSDDVCGKPNEDGDQPIVNPDGSITIPDGGTIVFPDGSEVEVPDGGTIKPDGSVETPDKDYKPDGSIKDPDDNNDDDHKPNPDDKPDYDVSPDIDSDGDGKTDINVDFDCDGKADINIDLNDDKIPDVNIDTTGDGKPNYNIDLNGDGKPDVNIGPVKWNPELCKTTACGKTYCTSSYYKPRLNVDTDGDGRPDINIDLTGDKEPNINVDIDGDQIPDIDIDSLGDGVANINVDENGDGRPDHKLSIITDWKPNLNVDQPILYDTMKDIIVDEQLTPDTWQSSKEYITIHGQGSSGTTVDTITSTENQPSYTGGAKTGNITKTVSLWVMVLLSGCASYIVHMIKKHKSI